MLDKITKDFNKSESNDTVLGYKLIRSVDGISFIPGFQKSKHTYMFNRWSVSDSQKILHCNNEASVYLSGFHCYLDRDEAYQAMMDEVMRRWHEKNNLRYASEIAAYLKIHECQCRNLICEGIQGGYKVIVAKENFVWAKPVDYSYLLNREDEELVEVPTKEMCTE